LAGTAGASAVGGGVGYMAGKADNKKHKNIPEVKKPMPKKFSPKKEETKTYQTLNLISLMHRCQTLLLKK
jgi:hypothetical protein